MTKEEIKQADKFTEEHVMHLHNGEYYAVNITGTYERHSVIGNPKGSPLPATCYRGVSDNGKVDYFSAKLIKEEFPHLEA